MNKLLRLVVMLEFFFLKSLYLMTIWNWFIWGYLLDYKMDYPAACSIVIVLAASRLKVITKKEEWEFAPGFLLTAIPVQFGLAFLLAYIIRWVIL